ncbi:HAD-IIA family hydrolase [Promethearchaeum syntrophicum]|uniref:HAD-IIA family hydrolase n=1 Tax=Promethearchaeum syntrophicum TaxID=2594042 RepID=A0A5B9D7H0_9ARCH|nr:UMP phosphatase [Candidatus Prometheoarchaeum syntrophicum]
MNKKLGFVRGILCDIDGTLYFRGRVIPNAIETVSFLQDKGYKVVFLTNTDSKTPKDILEKLLDFGFSVKSHDIFTPIIAIKEYISQFPDKKSYFLMTDRVLSEFQTFSQVTDDNIPDFVVISDFSDDWRIERLNTAFKYVLKGAKLIGSQGNRYYLDQEGNPKIDTGSLVKMVADAANVKPLILGKPNADYFKLALEKIGINANDAIIIGDDVESDIQGAQNAGVKGILVKTGKGQAKFQKNYESKIIPFLKLNSFSELRKLL